MKYIVTSEKSIDQAAADLETAVKANQFGVLNVQDLQATLQSKGIDFQQPCRVFDVCNPHQAHAVLTEDISMNMALPCRISIWQENGQTKIGTISPKSMLGMLSDSKKLASIAEEVDEVMQRIINDAK